MWCQLERTDFYIPESIQKANNLPAATVSMKNVAKLVEANNYGRGGITIAYKLKLEHIKPGKFNKMDVRLARDVFSLEVRTSLTLLAKDEQSSIPPEAETTGWFICLVHEWYFIMSNRHKSDALSKDEKSLAKRKTLMEFVELIRGLKFSKAPQRKPIQREIEMATLTTLQFHDE